MRHQYGIKPYYDSKDFMTVWLNKSDFFFFGGGGWSKFDFYLGECVMYYYSIMIYGGGFGNQSLKFLYIYGTSVVKLFIIGFSYCKANTVTNNIRLT